MLKTYAEVAEWAREYNATLQATDPRLRGSVKIVHEDGTALFFENAFVVQVAGHKVVFTEHLGYHVFVDDDLRLCRGYGPRLEIKEIFLESLELAPEWDVFNHWLYMRSLNSNDDTVILVVETLPEKGVRWKVSPPAAAYVNREFARGVCRTSETENLEACIEKGKQCAEENYERWLKKLPPTSTEY